MDTGSGTQTPTASGSGGQGSWRGGGGGPGGRSGRRGGGGGRNSQGGRVRSPLPYWLARRKARRPGDKGRRSGGRRFGRFRRDDRAIASSCHLSCSSRTAAGSPTMLLGLVGLVIAIRAARANQASCCWISEAGGECGSRSSSLQPWLPCRAHPARLRCHICRLITSKECLVARYVGERASQQPPRGLDTRVRAQSRPRLKSTLPSFFPPTGRPLPRSGRQAIL